MNDVFTSWHAIRPRLISLNFRCSPAFARNFRHIQGLSLWQGENGFLDDVDFFHRQTTTKWKRNLLRDFPSFRKVRGCRRRQRQCLIILIWTFSPNFRHDWLAVVNFPTVFPFLGWRSLVLWKSLQSWISKWGRRQKKRVHWKFLLMSLVKSRLTFGEEIFGFFSVSEAHWILRESLNCEFKWKTVVLVEQLWVRRLRVSLCNLKSHSIQFCATQSGVTCFGKQKTWDNFKLAWL